MICQACGTQNEAGRKFCIECGSALARVCPACGTPNPPNGKFCGECGDALTAPAPAAEGPQAPTATERRLVSVLFCDLVSFTTLSERRDAEDMRSLMSDYFETARAVIERHGGVVEKFIGDAVMAVWGTPVTHEDDAERAVRAALELVDAVAALGASVDAPLQARAGVLTGEAATSPDAGDQGMVTGDMVNTASRLQSAADPGAVFVGESTYRAASRAVVFEAAGALALKGKDAPVSAWRALRVVAERQGHLRMAVEPPFVGRGEELRLLKDLLHATGREGKARLASVTGIGGIGKSRLAWELQKYVDGLADDVYWHHGRCPAYGEGVAFWALGEMVRMRAEIAETDDPGVARRKLGVAVAAHVPDEEERRWLTPRLAYLLGLEDRPGGGREELFSAWRTYFERVAARGTVALVFEDLQWADEGLLDFVESMLEWSRAHPIFIVTLARPELADRRPTWGAGQRSFVALHLEPLPGEAMDELVRAMIPGASDAGVARIVDRAEGVPLYAVETIRMLADRGTLRASDQAYELVDDADLGELQVPETLHALIASRLDALAPADRALLQGAAVLGKSFTVTGLAAVTGRPQADLDPRLPELMRREFLDHEVDPRSPERGQYAFVQSIIREVAYGMLSKADRRSRHLAVAHHFESIGDEELAGVVAAHYVEALAATPSGPEADALAARARDALGQAATRAAGLGSSVQALGFLQQAIDITPPGRERADLLVTTATTARDALRWEVTIASLEEAVEVYGSIDDPDAQVTTLGLLANAYTDARGRVDAVRPIPDRMRAILAGGGSDLARAELDHTEAILRYFDQDLEGALAAIERGARAFDRIGGDRWRRVMGEKANLLAMVGRIREATLLLNGMVTVAGRDGDLRAMAQGLGALALFSPEFVEAVDLYEEAAAVARRGGYGSIEMGALANGLEFAIEAGKWDQADRFAASLAERPDLPDLAREPLTLGVALLAAYRGDADGADAAMAEVTEATSASDDPQLRAWARRIRAAMLLARGDLRGAVDEGKAVAAMEGSGPNVPSAVWTAGRAAAWLRDIESLRELLSDWTDPEEGFEQVIHRGVGAAVAALDGDARGALAAYETVLRGRLAANDRFAHALLVTDMVAVLPSDLVPADAVETARATLEELGAAPFLARLPARVPASP